MIIFVGNVLVLAGVAGFFYGAHQAWAPGAWMAGGLLLIYAAFQIQRNREKG